MAGEDKRKGARGGGAETAHAEGRARDIPGGAGCAGGGPDSQEDLLWKSWLAAIWEIPGAKRERLIETAGSIRGVYNMKKQHIDKMDMLTEREKGILDGARKRAPQEALEALLHAQAGLVTVLDEAYPRLLRDIPGRPFALYYTGRLPGERRCAAVVGARLCSEYGRRYAYLIGKHLAEAGLGIVSGMARGVDAQAQEGALDGGGYTCAVLGGGVDVCYPPGSRRLYGRLREEGGIVSEYPPGTPAASWHFPARNRIISGLAEAVVVVEARRKSGSLITADLALEQGRDVYAVPGRLCDPLSEGCNRLIFQGSGIVTGIGGLLAQLGVSTLEKINKTKKTENLLAKNENLLYSCVDSEPRSLEELAERSGLPRGETAELVVRLQLKGFLTEASKNGYVRVPGREP